MKRRLHLAHETNSFVEVFDFEKKNFKIANSIDISIQKYWIIRGFLARL